jgi:hypothetical protein
MMRRLFQPMMKHRSLAIKTPGGFVAGGRRPAREIPAFVGAQYDFLTPPVPGELLEGQIMLPEGNQGAMRVHCFDVDGTDFSRVIKALTFLDEISFGGATWYISSISISEYDTYCIFPVILKSGSIPVDARYDVTVRRP